MSYTLCNGCDCETMEVASSCDLGKKRGRHEASEGISTNLGCGIYGLCRVKGDVMTTTFLFRLRCEGQSHYAQVLFPPNDGSGPPAVWLAQPPSPDCQQSCHFTAPQVLTSSTIKEWYLDSALDTKIANGLGKVRCCTFLIRRLFTNATPDSWKHSAFEWHYQSHQHAEIFA